MKPKRDIKEYAKEHYANNRERKIHYGKLYYYGLNPGDELPVKKIKKQQNIQKERKRQEEITRIWRFTGEFILPDERIIEKLVEKEIYIEEHIDDDVVDYIELEECIKDEENNEDNGEE